MKIVEGRIVFEASEQISRVIVIAKLEPSAWDPTCTWAAIARSFVRVVDARSKTLKLEPVEPEGALLSDEARPHLQASA